MPILFGCTVYCSIDSIESNPTVSTNRIWFRHWDKCSLAFCVHIRYSVLSSTQTLSIPYFSVWFSFWLFEFRKKRTEENNNGPRAVFIFDHFLSTNFLLISSNNNEANNYYHRSAEFMVWRQHKWIRGKKKSSFVVAYDSMAMQLLFQLTFV